MESTILLRSRWRRARWVLQATRYLERRFTEAGDNERAVRYAARAAEYAVIVHETERELRRRAANPTP